MFHLQSPTDAYSTKAVDNLSDNHSAENSGNWTSAYWGSSGASYNAYRTSSESFFGNYSLSLTGNTIPNNAGGYHYQDVSSSVAKPGETYTFSAYVKTTGVEKANTANAGYGACLTVQFTSTSGTTLYSDYIKGTTDTSYEEGWRRLTLTFTVPEDCTNVRVGTLLVNATGSAYFDGMQLETGSAANPYNLLENSGFEKSSSPTHWNMISTDSDDAVSSDSYFEGTRALRVTGKLGVDKYVHQEVPIKGKESDIYIASAWAWADALPDAEDMTRTFEVYVKIYYSTGLAVYKDGKAEFIATVQS